MNQKQSYLALHFCVFVWGFTAILGGLISISALGLLWWRIFLTVISLFLIFRTRELWKAASWKRIGFYSGIGVLIALHWLTFFGSIKLANASIGVICLSTISILTAIVEPLLLRTKMKWYELFLGMLIIPGMWMIVQNVDVKMIPGIIVGISSAVFQVFFSVLNKRAVEQEGADPKLIITIEMISGLSIISLVLLTMYSLGNIPSFWPKGNDIYYLFILAFLCTTIPFFLSLKALKQITPFAGNFIINLEPVYGVILAWLILNEDKMLNREFYFGAGMILIAVMSYPFVKAKFEKP
jgi:drug/metabolite transporter (DMT)-like permease